MSASILTKSEDREEGEILDDEDVFEDISDNSIYDVEEVLPAGGKSVFYNDRLRTLSLSSVSDIDDTSIFEHYRHGHKTRCRKRSRSEKRNAYLRPRRTSDYSSDENDLRISKRIKKQLHEAVKIDGSNNREIHRNSLRARLKCMVKLHDDQDHSVEPLTEPPGKPPPQSTVDDKNTPNNNEDVDRELQELRLEALKTAIVNKHKIRKKGTAQDSEDVMSDSSHKSGFSENKENSAFVNYINVTDASVKSVNKEHITTNVCDTSNGQKDDKNHLPSPIEEDTDALRALALASLDKATVKTKEVVNISSSEKSLTQHKVLELKCDASSTLNVNVGTALRSTDNSKNKLGKNTEQKETKSDSSSTLKVNVTASLFCNDNSKKKIDGNPKQEESLNVCKLVTKSKIICKTTNNVNSLKHNSYNKSHVVNNIKSIYQKNNMKTKPKSSNVAVPQVKPLIISINGDSDSDDDITDQNVKSQDDSVGKNCDIPNNRSELNNIRKDETEIQKSVDNFLKQERAKVEAQHAKTILTNTPGKQESVKVETATTCTLTTDIATNILEKQERFKVETPAISTLTTDNKIVSQYTVTIGNNSSIKQENAKEEPQCGNATTNRITPHKKNSNIKATDMSTPQNNKPPNTQMKSCMKFLPEAKFNEYRSLLCRLQIAQKKPKVRRNSLHSTELKPVGIKKVSRNRIINSKATVSNKSIDKISKNGQLTKNSTVQKEIKINDQKNKQVVSKPVSQILNKNGSLISKDVASDTKKNDKPLNNQIASKALVVKNKDSTSEGQKTNNFVNNDQITSKTVDVKSKTDNPDVTKKHDTLKDMCASLGNIVKYQPLSVSVNHSPNITKTEQVCVNVESQPRSLSLQLTASNLQPSSPKLQPSSPKLQSSPPKLQSRSPKLQLSQILQPSSPRLEKRLSNRVEVDGYKQAVKDIQYNNNGSTVIHFLSVKLCVRACHRQLPDNFKTVVYHENLYQLFYIRLNFVEAKRKTNTEIKGKYQSLGNMLKKITEVCKERKKHELYITRLLQELSNANAQLTKCKENYKKLGENLVYQKGVIDKSLKKENMKNQLMSSKEQKPLSSIETNTIKDVTANVKTDDSASRPSDKENSVIPETNHDSSVALVLSDTSKDSSAEEKNICDDISSENKTDNTNPLHKKESSEVESHNETVVANHDRTLQESESPPTCSALPEVGKQTSQAEEASMDEVVQKDAIRHYVSPLGISSRCDEVDPLAIFCPYELSGFCRDPECKFNHFEKTSANCMNENC